MERERWQDRIVIDPKVLVGKPVVKGTRLAVGFVIELLAHDFSPIAVLIIVSSLAWNRTLRSVML